MTIWHERDSFWETVPIFSQRLVDLAPQDAESILGLLDVAPGIEILDLCCGIGRHSLELARRGYRVTGVDRTAAYLQTARDRADATGLSVEWVQADMREFVRPEAYAAALNVYTSFGYFEDPAEDRQVLENLLSSLKPGGRLLLDVMGKEVLARIFVPRDWQELPDGSLFLQQREVSRDWTWMENRWIVIKEGQRHEYAVNHRIYDGSGLRDLLLDVGFEAVRLHGDLGGAPYDRAARRLVAVADKALRA